MSLLNSVAAGASGAGFAVGAIGKDQLEQMTAAGWKAEQMQLAARLQEDAAVNAAKRAPIVAGETKAAELKATSTAVETERVAKMERFNTALAPLDQQSTLDNYNAARAKQEGPSYTPATKIEDLQPEALKLYAPTDEQRKANVVKAGIGTGDISSKDVMLDVAKEQLRETRTAIAEGRYQNQADMQRERNQMMLAIATIKAASGSERSSRAEFLGLIKDTNSDLDRNRKEIEDQQKIIKDRTAAKVGKGAIMMDPEDRKKLDSDIVDANAEIAKLKRKGDRYADYKRALHKEASIPMPPDDDEPAAPPAAAAPPPAAAPVAAPAPGRRPPLSSFAR